MEVMNDRLLNHPMPPTVPSASISPQLQEVIYRALERDPQNRYAKAREFAHDLQHLDEVGVEERAELRDWHKRKSPAAAQIDLLWSAGADSGGVILLLMVLSRIVPVSSMRPQPEDQFLHGILYRGT